MSALRGKKIFGARILSRFYREAAAVMLCAVACLTIPAAVRAQQIEAASSPKRILLLHQAGPGPFRGRFDLAFSEAIRAAGSTPVDVYEEAIDAQRFPGPDQSQLVKEFLKVKYAGRTIDVIVAQGMLPLTFARQNRGLFGNPPIVASVSPLGQIDRTDNTTGLQGGFWVNGTIDLAIALLPDTRNVIVIDGARENSPELQADIERKVQERRDGLTLEYLRDLPLRDVISRVSTPQPRSIVLFLKQSMLDLTNDVDQFEALDQIVRASPVPVFSQLDEFFGHGIVGGYIWRFEQDARRLADMARQLADGARVDDVPPGRASYDSLVDWRQLQRWGIPESRVPAGSVVLYRQPTLLEQNSRYFVGTLVIFSAQFALILALLVQRRQRRRAEAESRDTKERYRSVVDTQSEMICRFLPDTTLTFVNDAYCRFRKTMRGDLLGTQFITPVPEPARQQLLERLQNFTGSLDSSEQPATLADGSIGWHHWAIQAIRDGKDRLVEFQGVGRDITEQKRAQEALVHAEARNSAMLRAVPDLMFVMLRDGTYVDYHAKDLKLLLAPPSAFLGRKVRDIMPPKLAEVFMEAIEGACDREETVIVEYDLPLDETRYFESRVVHIDGNRVLAMVRDVTDSKRVLALNRDLTGRLIASQEVERQRIARELHDDVSQKVALLNIGIDEVARQVQEIDAGARLRQLSVRTREIVGDLRDLSHELHASRLQSLGLIAAIEFLCRDASKQLGVTVPFTHGALPQDVDPNVSLCLYRIAQEALTNIVRHSHARHAQVTLIYENPMLMLQVADSGVGFDVQSTHHGGLGLISMRDRVAFLRGQLAIHAAPGGGTRIGVNIPIGLPTQSSAPVVSLQA